MRNPSTTEIFESFTHPRYEIRVRDKAFLWGSDGISHDIIFEKALILHIRNDIHGEPLTFGTQVASGTKQTLGTIQPGQCVSIPLQKIVAVFATCNAETLVGCIINP